MSQKAEYSLGLEELKAVFSNLLVYLVYIWTLPSEGFKAFFSVSIQPGGHGPLREGLITPVFFSSPPTLTPALPAVQASGKGESLLTTCRCDLYSG